MESPNWTRGMGAAASGFLVLISIVGWFVALLIITIRREALSIGWNGPAPDPEPFEEYATTGDMILLFAVLPLLILLISTLPPKMFGVSWREALVAAFLAHLPVALLFLGTAAVSEPQRAEEPIAALLWMSLFSGSAAINVFVTLLLMRPIPTRAVVVMCGVLGALIATAVVVPGSLFQDAATILSLACWPLIPGLAGLLVHDPTIVPTTMHNDEPSSWIAPS